MTRRPSHPRAFGRERDADRADSSERGPVSGRGKGSRERGAPANDRGPDAGPGHGARGRRGGRSGDEARDTGEGGRTDILAGWHPVHEALRAGDRRIGRILVAQDRHDSRAGEIFRLAKEARIPLSRVPSEALRRIVPKGLPHQGIVAEVAPRAYSEAADLLGTIGGQTLFLVLDEIQDPRNLGAILRTAAAVGASGAFLPLHRSAALTAAASRASAGGSDHVPVARVSNLGNLLESLGNEGVVRVGLDPRANDLYTRMPGDRPLALVLGGEERGLRPSIRAACDLLVRIPVPGRVESLNVSVAAALALYEVLRARSASSRESG